MNYMRRAMSLAGQALGSTSPNPAVGAVVIKDGEVVGEGATEPPGGDHAEIVALKQAGDKASGSTLHVTLEPCNHHGKTPQCTEAIIAAGVSDVHVAVRDPNPSVVGGGLERLESEGIGTHLGAESAAVERQLEAWLQYTTTGKPFVTAKFAMSLDGKIATRTGDSKWVTGDKARWYVHNMRAQADVVMVGIDTVISDDPRLTARDERGNPRDHQPLRVVADSRGRMPMKARMLSEPGESLVTVGPNARLSTINSNQENVLIKEFPLKEGRVDLKALLDYLAVERGVTGIMVESGGRLLGSLFDRGLVDKVVAFIAPTIVGGVDASSPVSGLGAETMADAVELQRVRWKRLGRDMAIIGYC